MGKRIYETRVAVQCFLNAGHVVVFLPRKTEQGRSPTLEQITCKNIFKNCFWKLLLTWVSNPQLNTKSIKQDAWATRKQHTWKETNLWQVHSFFIFALPVRRVSSIAILASNISSMVVNNMQEIASNKREANLPRPDMFPRRVGSKNDPTWAATNPCSSLNPRSFCLPSRHRKLILRQRK